MLTSVEDGDVLTYSLDDDSNADASNGVNMDTDVRFFTIDKVHRPDHGEDAAVR